MRGTSVHVHSEDENAQAVSNTAQMLEDTRGLKNTARKLSYSLVCFD